MVPSSLCVWRVLDHRYLLPVHVDPSLDGLLDPRFKPITPQE